jgi:hypothetical protein
MELLGGITKKNQNPQPTVVFCSQGIEFKYNRMLYNGECKYYLVLAVKKK